MKLIFPSSFIFGVSDADLQVIGEQYTRKFEGSLETMWRHFCIERGLDTPDQGIERYDRWAQDIEEMKRMRLSAYRTSISMARIMKRDGSVNAKAIHWYQSYFSALCKAGIKIYATLYHWELPQYVSENGGWKNRNTAALFAKHAEYVYENLDEYIEEYFLINEARHASIRSYYEGKHAPGETNIKNALLASHHINLAQGLAYAALSSKRTDVKISTVITPSISYAHTTKEADITAARLANAAKTYWFTDPLFKGVYPQEMLDKYGTNAPAHSPEDMKIIKIGNKLHSVGINYYKGSIVTSDTSSPRGFRDVAVDSGKTNDLGWPIFVAPHYPNGLYDVVGQMYYRYADYGMKKIYITENGAAYKPVIRGGIDHDDARIWYIQEHLKQLHDLILLGVPIQGYFVWTFMDNFEWAEGYNPVSSFGLISVDRTTMKRTWKKSAHWYKALVESHALDYN